jgi:hypothetical protein
MELRRIAKVAIFKVPLENNVLSNTIDIISHGKSRKKNVETMGHINIYNYWNLKSQIETHCGKILCNSYTNVFDYYLASDHYAHQMRNRAKILNYIASCAFKTSLKLCSCLFNDFVMILAECKKI